MTGSRHITGKLGDETEDDERRVADVHSPASGESYRGTNDTLLYESG